MRDHPPAAVGRGRGAARAHRAPGARDRRRRHRHRRAADAGRRTADGRGRRRRAQPTSSSASPIPPENTLSGQAIRHRRAGHDRRRGAIRRPDRRCTCRTVDAGRAGHGAAAVGEQRRMRGALVVGRLSGRPPFDDADLDMATTFANHAAVALELADARADQQRDRSARGPRPDRARPARPRDPATVRRRPHPRQACSARVLDAARGASADASSTRSTRRSARSARRSSSCAASSGPATGSAAHPAARRDRRGPPAAAGRTAGRIRRPGRLGRPRRRRRRPVAVLREALTNIARHAARATASRSRSAASANDGSCSRSPTTVSASGTTTRRSGLANLRATRRAARRDVRPIDRRPPDSSADRRPGTRLQWTVPLP